MDMDKHGLAKKISWDTTDLKTLRINLRTELNAEDLLNISLPFGYVVSVQKIVKTGFAYGLVTYSNADDAAVAVIKLSGNKGILVGLFEPREIREAHKNERSESLLQDGFTDTSLQRLPSLFDTLCPPAYSQTVSPRIHNLPKHIDERYLLLSLLPESMTDVKVDKRRALVTLPDISTALWLIN